MTTKATIFVAAVVAALPYTAQAAVRINEVAWMGSDGTGGGNCEWIELYNTGDEVVDLSSWSIHIENPGSSKELLLGDTNSRRFSGVAARGYYFVARNTTSCTHVVANDLIDWLGSFGNGISNEGAKLTLRQGAETIDTVDALAGWKTSGIGGTNTSPKKTPQYTGSVWHEALPTPRNTNTFPELEELPEEEEATSTPAITVGGTSMLTPLVAPVPKLVLSLVPDRMVVAKAHTPYSVVVYDSTGKVRRDAEVSWAFGDGGSKKGRTTAYAYQEPGNYTAVVRANAKGASVLSLVEVLAHESSVSIEEVSERGISLRNDGEHLADLSSWKLKTGRKTFRFPEDTVILAGRTVLFPSAVTGLVSEYGAALLYPDGSLADEVPALSADAP